jgi:hypothetical protein
MEERLKLKPVFYIGTIVLIVIGIVAMITGFINDPVRTWAGFLVNNVYFVSLALGAVLFLSLQRVTQSGWSAGFIRVPEAMGMFIPVAAILFLVMIPGIHSLYHWSHADAVAHDPILQHKQPYLNTPFWVIRMVVFFILWTLLAWMLRRYSLREDREGGMDVFRKAEHTGKIFIFVIAITFSIAGFDWIMSIDPHWYSALFALKHFVASFYHAAAIIAFIVLLLNQFGYFKFLSKSHMHDFSSYVFMLCIIWGYFWFAEFMLIWYANIPEETVYFVPRMKTEEWRIFFFGNVIINWLLPFTILMPAASRRNPWMLKIIIPILLVGFYVDLYLQVFPGVVGEQVLGFTEIGSFAGFAGLFTLVTGYVLSRANLVPSKHPYLEECLEHHV